MASAVDAFQWISTSPTDLSKGQATQQAARAGEKIQRGMMTTVVVFGGTGFVGWRLVQHMAAEGATVRVAVRHPDGEASVAAASTGGHAVANAVSAYVEKGNVTFEACTCRAQGRRSPPVRLTLSRWTAWRAEPRRVFGSSRFCRKGRGGGTDLYRPVAVRSIVSSSLMRSVDQSKLCI